MAKSKSKPKAKSKPELISVYRSWVEGRYLALDTGNGRVFHLDLDQEPAEELVETLGEYLEFHYGED